MAKRRARKSASATKKRGPRRVVVCGDVSIDWLDWPLLAKDVSLNAAERLLNWQMRGGSRLKARGGGALLLARFVEAATGLKVVTHVLEDYAMTPPERVVYSLMQIRKYPGGPLKSKETEEVYRVKAFHGFCGPDDRTPEPLP